MKWLLAALICLAAAAHAQSPSGVLIVESAPASALVYLDGVQAGQTPFRGTVPAGQVRVRVLRPGSLPFDSTVAIAAGGTVRVSAVLAAQTGSVVPGTMPAGATFRVAGAPTDGPAEVFAGPVQATVTLASGEAFRTRVRVTPGTETRVSYSPRTLDGTAALLGMLVPGGAQIRGGRTGVGVALALGVGTGVAGAVLIRGAERRARRRLEDAYAAYNAAPTEADAVAAYAAVERESDARGRARTLRNAATGAAFAVAAASVVDAFVHHVRRPGLAVDRPRVLTAALGPSGPSLLFSLSF